MLNQVIGKAFLKCYKVFIRVSCKVFSLLIGGGFARFGVNSVLQYPVRLSGEDRLAIGDGVFIGANSWLQALPDENSTSTALYIGSGTSIAGGCVISAVRRVIIEEDVLLARNVYIADHSHNYENLDRPILYQGLCQIKPVVIKSGAWIGQNVVVCPGVTIGKGAVIGANSVVKDDIPNWSLAVGAPARIVRRFGATGLPTE